MPEVVGETSGVTVTEGVLNFYDGVIKGAPLAIRATIGEVESGYVIMYSSDDIYEVATLKNTLKLNFESNGGNQIPSKTVTYGGVYGDLETPIKTGYIFNGWYKEVGFINKVESTTIVTTSSEHTLYAKWTENNYQNVRTSAYYDTLQKAIAGATAGDTIKMLSDYTDTSTIIVSKNITLDLYKHKMTRSATITVNSGSSFTITGESSGQIESSATRAITNSGTLIISEGIKITGSTVVYNNGGTITVNNGVLEGTNYGIEAPSTPAGTITIKKGRVTGNSYGIYATSSLVIIGVSGGGVSTTDPYISGIHGVNAKTIRFYDGIVIGTGQSGAITGKAFTIDGSVTTIPSGYKIDYFTSGIYQKAILVLN